MKYKAYLYISSHLLLECTKTNPTGKDEMSNMTTPKLTSQDRRIAIIRIDYAQENLRQALKDLKEDNEAYDQSAVNYIALAIKNLQA